MALLERVTLLIKANLNDLIDKAEQPEKLLKQLLLDMQNQFMQVKTQLAIAIANQNRLQTQQRESMEAQQHWLRQAEYAMGKQDEGLARAAIERALAHETAAGNFAQQKEAQAEQVQTLRAALQKLEQKMAETSAKSELLLAQHRKARVAERTGTSAAAALGHDAVLQRARSKVSGAEAEGAGASSLAEPTLEQRCAALEKTERVDRVLDQLKAKLERAS